MGDVRALNIWLSMSHCGDDAPGLDIVPHRIDHIVPTGTEDAIFPWSVAPAVAEETAGGEGTVRPIFEPGDAVIFDELCLHSTYLDARMTKTRYALSAGSSARPRSQTTTCRWRSDPPRPQPNGGLDERNTRSPSFAAARHKK
jgi:hypothetical protein